MKREMPPIHPAANLFPMLPPEELQALADDIKANGLQQPIVMFGAMLLDGRNRWRACDLAGVEPRVKDWNGTEEQAIRFVGSCNLKRRDLTASQKGAIALALEEMEAIEAKKRQREHGGTAPGRNTGAKVCTSEPGKARDKAAAAAGVNRQYVSDAKAIKKQAPHLLPKVISGELTIPEAKAVAALQPEEQGVVLEKLDNGQARNAKEAVRQLNRDKLRVVTLDEAAQGRFQVIYADPPWRYSNSGFDGSAENQYPTMATEEICAMPIGERAASNSVLLMWAVWPLLPDALRVMEAWGFAYKTGAVWKKNVHVGGFYFLGITELLLVGVRGSCTPKPGTLVQGFFDYPRSKHSKKPPEFYDLIERMYDGPYLELFAREKREGWTSFGNQLEAA